MRIVRFRDGGTARHGLVDGAAVRPCDGSTFTPHGAPRPLADVTLLPPCAASKMVAIWGNSRPLQESRKAPATVDLCYVIKPPSSFITHGDAIVLPAAAQRVIFEGELGVVIGRRCRNVAEGEAARVIAGYTIVNEVTAVDLVPREPSFAQHTRAKGFDTFGVFGPAVETDVDISGARIRTWQNGEQRQDFAVADLIRGPRPHHRRTQRRHDPGAGRRDRLRLVAGRGADARRRPHPHRHRRTWGAGKPGHGGKREHLMDIRH